MILIVPQRMIYKNSNMHLNCNNNYDVMNLYNTTLTVSKIIVPAVTSLYNVIMFINNHCGKADVRTIGYLQPNMVGNLKDQIL